jgi:hypothetical protein
VKNLDRIRNYFDSLELSLLKVFECAGNISSECRKLVFRLECPEELKETNIHLATLLQFGDIVVQSFESLDAMFDEISRLESGEEKLHLLEAGKFSKLMGMVSSNTFLLVGRSVSGLVDKLKKMEVVINTVKEIGHKDPDEAVLIKSFSDLLARGLDEIKQEIKGMVMQAGPSKLFSLEKIAFEESSDEKSLISERLYEKFRIREHIEILSNIFPNEKRHSDKGSLELF